MSGKLQIRHEIKGSGKGGQVSIATTVSVMTQPQSGIDATVLKQTRLILLPLGAWDGRCCHHPSKMNSPGPCFPADTHLIG